MDISSIMHATQIKNILNENQRHEAVINDFQSILDKAMNDQSAIDSKALKEACEAFESYFIQMMFREMRKTSFRDKNSFIPLTNAEKIFTEMMDEETAKAAAKAGGSIAKNFSSSLHCQTSSSDTDKRRIIGF